MKYEESILINRPIADVFAYVSDYSTHSKWAGAVRVDMLTEGPMGVGTKVYYVDRFMGREVGMESEITRYEPPNRMGYKIVRGMAAEALQTFTEENGGTRMTWEYWANPSGMMKLFKVAEPLIVKQGQKTLKESLARLKAELEKPS